MKCPCICRLLMPFLFVLTYNVTIAQFATSTDMPNFSMNDSFPQTHPNSIYPGNYEIVGSLSKSSIYKEGDTTRLRIKITGYGNIFNYKIFFSISEPIFEGKSPVVGQAKLVKVNTKGFYIRVDADTATGQVISENNSGVMTLGGLIFNDWGRRSIFFDIDTAAESLAVFSESTQGIPGDIYLVLKNSVPPGDYNINLVFTYFNGSEWKSSTNIIPIHVNTLWEEKPWIINSLSIMGVGYALIALILQIWDFILNFKHRKRKKRMDNNDDDDDGDQDNKKHPIITTPTGSIKTGKKKNKLAEAQKKQRQERMQKFVWKVKSLFLRSRNTERFNLKHKHLTCSKIEYN